MKTNIITIILMGVACSFGQQINGGGAVGGGGTVTGVTATAPIVSSGGTAPVISGTYEGNGSKIQLFTGADPATNGLPKYDANHNLVGTSSITDDGTSVTTTEPINAASFTSGATSAAKAALPAGAKGSACDESSTAGVPAPNVDYTRCDSVTHTIVASFNNTAEASLVTLSTASLPNTTSIGGVPTANITQTTTTPTANQICVYAGTSKTCTPTTTLPAAATGYGNPVATITGHNTLTGNLGSTLAYTSTEVGWYEVCLEAITTIAATTSSSLPALNVAFTSSLTGVATTPNIIAGAFPNSSNFAGVGNLGCTLVHTTSGTAINISTSGYVSVGAQPLTYNLDGMVYSRNADGK